MTGAGHGVGYTYICGLLTYKGPLEDLSDLMTEDYVPPVSRYRNEGSEEDVRFRVFIGYFTFAIIHTSRMRKLDFLRSLNARSVDRSKSIACKSCCATTGRD